MGQYWSTFVAVALLSGIVGMVAPEGDVKKYVRLAGALCLLCAITQPLLGWMREGEGLPDDWWAEIEDGEEVDYVEIYNQSLMVGGEKNAEMIIKNGILSHFGISDTSLDVEVDFTMEEETVLLREVRLTVREEAILTDPRDLTDYINARYSCPCTVVYD